MRVSFIKLKKDINSFRTWRGLGFEVVELEDLEQTDLEIDKLIQNKYNTIFITTQVAAFSEDIFKKYKNNQDINIVIVPDKRK